MDKELKWGDKVHYEEDDNYQQSFTQNAIVKRVMVEVEIEPNIIKSIPLEDIKRGW